MRADLLARAGTNDPPAIQCQWNKTEFVTQVSYPLPTKRFLPVEAYLKTIFPLLALVGEICSEGPSFTDADGNFRKPAQMQHMSIYGMFIAHGLIDILLSHGVPLPKGLDFLSAIAAFLWYGLSFSFHAHMHGKEAVETTIHLLPITTMYALAVAGIMELINPHLFLAAIARTYCILLLGTWFFQASFVMYLPYPWPGSDLNPRWDQTDPRNVNFIVASYGYHMILDMVVITVVYLLCYIFLKVKGEGRNQFKLLINEEGAEERGYQFKPLMNNSHPETR